MNHSKIEEQCKHCYLSPCECLTASAPKMTKLNLCPFCKMQIKSRRNSDQCEHFSSETGNYIELRRAAMSSLVFNERPIEDELRAEIERLKKEKPLLGCNFIERQNLEAKLEIAKEAFKDCRVATQWMEEMGEPTSWWFEQQLASVGIISCKAIKDIEKEK